MTLFAQLAVLQGLLPLALVILNAVVPCRTWVEYAARLAFGLVLFVLLTHGGVWIFPPFWWPWAVLALHLVWAAWMGRRLLDAARPRARPVWPGVRAVIFAGLAVAGLVALVPMVTGRGGVEGEIDLAYPLGPGRFLVVSGGADASINAHFLTLGDAERFLAYRGQSYAVDVVGLTRLGLTAENGLMPGDPAAYAIFGTPVRAPCAGTVRMAVDGLPDQPVPEADRAKMAGNHVILDCGDLRVVLAHFERGSVAVRVGDAVGVGDPLGRVGNSGNTGQPHLHIHVQRGGTDAAPLSGQPVWFTVDGRFLVRGDRFAVGR